MGHVTVSRRIPAPPAAVWGVLADFPNIADWNGGITQSYATGDKVEGVGATRHCDLKPVGKLEETVTDWVEGERMVVRIDSAARLPIRQGLVTFELEGENGGQATTVTVDYEFSTKLGFMEKALVGSVERQLAKGFDGFLADLDTAATSAPTGA